MKEDATGFGFLSYSAAAVVMEIASVVSADAETTADAALLSGFYLFLAVVEMAVCK